MKKFRFLAVFLLIVLVMSAVLGACVKPNDDDNQGGNQGGGNQGGGGNQDEDEIYYFDDDIIDSKVEQYFDDLGYVNRKLPSETKDGGLDRYPVYGTTLPLKAGQTRGEWVAEAKAILTENMQYISTTSENLIDVDEKGHPIDGTTHYDSMDENGYFYLNGEHVKDNNGQNLKLFKHTTADDLYYGGLSDSEKAIKRRVTITPRIANYDDYITGLYAPAGEIVKIEVTQADLDACGGSFYIYIGQHLLSGKANNIWISKDETSVGNGNNLNRMPIIATKFKITQTVTYVGSFFGGPIYIGKPMAKKTFSATISGGVPYSNFILGLTTEEEFNKYKDSTVPYFDLEVWDDSIRFSGPKKYAEPYSYQDLKKTALLWDKISRVSNVITCSSNQNVGIEFMFDPFVAAGAAVAFGGNNSVNCPDGWMTGVLNYESFVKSGSWGNIHEYNHHYQSFGLSERSEVTNNATSLVEYALFTNISAGRTLDKAYTSGEAWNRFTDARGALNETLNAQAKGTANYTLSSYADLLHAFGPKFMLQVMRTESNSDGTDNWFKALSRTMKYDFTYYFEQILHVPVSDSAKAEIAGKNYPVFVPVATTLQVGRLFENDGTTYNSNTMRPFEVDPSKPFEFNLQETIVAPSNFEVTIKKVTSPSSGTLTSKDGVYTYTFGDSDTSGIFYVTLALKDKNNEVTVNDITLALNFKKKTNLNYAEKVVYTFEDGVTFSSLKEAKEHMDEATQAVTQVTSADSSRTNNVANNTLVEFTTQFKVSSAGKYRFALGARDYAQLYISLDGTNYELVADIENKDIHRWQGDDSAETNGFYADYDLKSGQSVYLKLYSYGLKTTTHCAQAVYYSIGYGKFNGANVSISAIPGSNMYTLDSHEEEFTSDYFYGRIYTTSVVPTVISSRYDAHNASWGLANLFDNDVNTFIHTKDGVAVTENNTFELTVDLQQIATINSLTMIGRRGGSGYIRTPIDFQLYGGLAKNDLKLIGEWSDVQLVDIDEEGNAKDAYVTFNDVEVRYYKLVVTKAFKGGPVCFAELIMGGDILTLTNAQVLSANNEAVVLKNGWTKNVNGTFGYNMSPTSTKSTMEIEFMGTQFALYSFYTGKPISFEISIDGGEFKKVTVSNETNSTMMTYLSKELSQGNHKIVLRSFENFNFDSVAVV